MVLVALPARLLFACTFARRRGIHKTGFGEVSTQGARACTSLLILRWSGRIYGVDGMHLIASPALGGVASIYLGVALAWVHRLPASPLIGWLGGHGARSASATF